MNDDALSVEESADLIEDTAAQIVAYAHGLIEERNLFDDDAREIARRVAARIV